MGLAHRKNGIADASEADDRRRYVFYRVVRSAKAFLGLLVQHSQVIIPTADSSASKEVVTAALLVIGSKIFVWPYQGPKTSAISRNHSTA